MVAYDERKKVVFVVDALIVAIKADVAVSVFVKRLFIVEVPKLAIVPERFAMKAFVVVVFSVDKFVPVALSNNTFVATRFVVVANDAKKLEVEAVIAVNKVADATVNVVVPRNVLSPAKICDVVETRPRENSPASGILKM